MLVLEAFDERRRIERSSHAKQSTAKRGDPDLVVTVAQETPGTRGKPNLACVLRRRSASRELADDVARVGHPDRAGGVFGEALHVGGASIDELEHVAVAAIDTRRRTDPQPSGTILVEAEGLSAGVALRLAHLGPSTV